MNYPRIPHNFAVKFKRGVALGMAAVMLLTGTPATSITSHATETTGTEVQEQSETATSEQTTATEAVTEEVTTEVVTTETEEASTEAATVSEEQTATEAVTEATTEAATETTTEEKTSKKKRSKTEETVEELNKQTNNSKYAGYVSSSYSWSDSSGTHFHWSVQKKGSGHQNAYCLRHGRHMGNEVSAAAANVGQLAGKYGFSMALLMRLVNDGKLSYTDAQYSIWANCNTGTYVSYTDYVWKLHPDNSGRKAGTSVGYPKTVTPVSGNNVNERCDKAKNEGTAQQIKKKYITTNADKSVVLSVNNGVVDLNSTAWSSLAQNESGLGSSVSVVGIYKNNNGSWSDAKSGSATLNSSANKLTVSYDTESGAYGVSGNPMVVLFKIHAPNAGGGIEYLSWGTAEWDGQSELQSLAVGTYGKSEDFYYAMPVFATTNPEVGGKATIRINKRDQFGNDVSLTGGSYAVYKYTTAGVFVADLGTLDGAAAQQTGWTIDAGVEGVDWYKNTSYKVAYHKADGSVEYHHPAVYNYYYRLIELSPPPGLSLSGYSDIKTLATGAEVTRKYELISVNGTSCASLMKFYVNKSGELNLLNNIGPGQSIIDPNVSYSTETVYQNDKGEWVVPGPNTTVVAAYYGPAASDWDFTNPTDGSPSDGTVNIINNRKYNAGKIEINKKVLPLMVGYDKTTKTPQYENIPLPGVKFRLYAKNNIGIGGNLQTIGSIGFGTYYTGGSWDPYIYPIFNAGDEITAGCTANTVWSTMLGYSVTSSDKTSVDGTMSWGNLPPGTYIIKEELDQSVKEFSQIDAPLETIEATIDEDGNTTYSKNGVSVGSTLGDIVNTTQKFQCHVSKVDKDGNGLEGAEFTLYADVNMTNILGNRVFSDSDAEDAIIAVENGQPVYESG